MKKLLRVLLYFLFEIVTIPLKIFFAIQFVVCSVYYQIRFRYNKDEWTEIFNKIGENLDGCYATVFNYIETGKFTI